MLLLPGAYLTVSQLSTGLKEFLGKFNSHNYFDDASVDSNSGTIIYLYVKGQDALALYYIKYEQRAPLGSCFNMRTCDAPSLRKTHRDKSIDTDKVVREFCARPRPYILECHANTALSLRSS